jgi:hypothetical protein
MKLNLGSGKTPLNGYGNVDIADGRTVYPLEGIEDGSVSEIRASHVLEHFSHREVGDVLMHWVSKLEPGGVLKIAVPDLEKIAKGYLDGKRAPWQAYLMGGQVDEYDFHGSAFDAEALTEVLAACGLERIGYWESDAQDCSSLPVSLNMCAYKPSEASADMSGVFGVLQSARVGYGAHHACMYRTIRELGITHTMSVGCFWFQGWTSTVQDLLAIPECKWILSMDYDSVFRAGDVRELYRLARAYPAVDAVAAVQSMRHGSQSALFSVDAKDIEVASTMFERNLTKVKTAHFGCTLINADKLREMPKPWMCPVPSPNGEWEKGDGHIDADIYFWREWEKQGNNLYLANRVPIGHLEEMVKWPGKGFRPVYQGYKDFLETGPPPEVNTCV